MSRLTKQLLGYCASVIFLAFVLTSCGGGGGGSETMPASNQAPTQTEVPIQSMAREVVSTDLTVDLSAKAAIAEVSFASSNQAGARLEVGDLILDKVQLGDQALAWTRRGDKLDLALPASTTELVVHIEYRYQWHENADGASSRGFTMTQPTFCGNLFPCHSATADGVNFSLKVTHPPAGQQVVSTDQRLLEIPAYQVAWTVGNYTDLDLGTTPAGTHLVASYMPGERDAMTKGTANLRDAFQWLETTLGPYRFGQRAGPVSVDMRNNIGGMEHHPRWFIDVNALDDPNTHVHEAVHGWFGDGVRMACWEDVVLSEGTTSYLTARALEQVAPAVGAQIWSGYARILATYVNPKVKVWPQGCNQLPAVTLALYDIAVYMRGAYFYRALAQKLGATEVDRILGNFYRRYAGKAASFNDILTQIQSDTGYDPRACAKQWLQDDVIPAFGPCP